MKRRQGITWSQVLDQLGMAGMIAPDSELAKHRAAQRSVTSPGLPPDLPGEPRNGAECTRTADERENATQGFTASELFLLRLALLVAQRADVSGWRREQWLTQTEAENVRRQWYALAVRIKFDMSPTASPQEDADR